MNLIFGIIIDTFKGNLFWLKKRTKRAKNANGRKSEKCLFYLFDGTTSI